MGSYLRHTREISNRWLGGANKIRHSCESRNLWLGRDGPGSYLRHPRKTSNRWLGGTNRIRHPCEKLVLVLRHEGRNPRRGGAGRCPLPLPNKATNHLNYPTCSAPASTSSQTIEKAPYTPASPQTSSSRVWQHKEGTFKGFSKEHGLHRLVYYELHGTMDDAMAREKRVKKWKRAWKIELIEGMNPAWLDLYTFIL